MRASASAAAMGAPQGLTTEEAIAWVRDYLRALRHGRLKPFTFTERKARAATRAEPWGPTGPQLKELAALSFEYEHLPLIFGVLRHRMTAPPHLWRKVYKALTVLEFIVTRGSEECGFLSPSDLGSYCSHACAGLVASPPSAPTPRSGRHPAAA